MTGGGCPTAITARTWGSAVSASEQQGRGGGEREREREGVKARAGSKILAAGHVLSSQVDT
eukprot:1492538-Rhodomonas_salina.3